MIKAKFSIFSLLLLIITSSKCEKFEMEKEIEDSLEDGIEFQYLDESEYTEEPTRIFEASPKLLTHLEGEIAFLEELDQYIQTTEKNLKTLKNYVEKTLEIYDSKESDYQEVLSNPINSYLLMRRSTIDIEDIVKVQIDEPVEKLKEAVKEMRLSKLLPSIEDFTIATDGFLSLQVTYELETPAMRHGFLLSTTFRDVPPNMAEKLTHTDCRLLSVHSLNILSFEKYHDWKGQADTLGQSVEEFTLPSPFTDDIEAKSVEKLKQLKEIGFDTDPPIVDSEKTSFCPMFGVPKVKKNYNITLYSTSISEPQTLEQFQRLCRGEKLRPISLDSQLRCKLFEGFDGYYRLQPIKLEEVSLDPLVVVFHDVIRDREMESLINLAQDKLGPAFQFSTNGSLYLSSARISSNSWISTRSNKDIFKQSKKLEMMIGLRTEDTDGSAEQYQVNNYGTSGLYRPHYDYFVKEIEDQSKFNGRTTGNRIATVMYYLNEVPSGGATVFPYIGATIWPKKGDAVFWWNLKPNGDLVQMTRHGGCPVLFGTKWVANRWILSHNQMFRKKCDTDPNANFKRF